MSFPCSLVGSEPATAVNIDAIFVDRETPTGAVDGSNTTFVLAYTPYSGSEYVYLNGNLLEPGAGNDYTISGKTITLAFIPEAGGKILVSYRK